MTNHDQIGYISDKTGLQQETVKDLLESGWTFCDEVKKPRYWIDPSAKLKHG